MAVTRLQPLDSRSTGTSVFQLTAVDADDPTVAEHTTIMYHIVKGDEYFGISDSGL